MKIGDKHYTKDEILQRVGSVSQLGGARHYVLSDGRSKGVAAVDVDTGAGLCFTILPDRGLDISLASYKGTNLVYLTQNGEASPSFYEPQGLGWLRTFFAGLLTTCGLTSIGMPGNDQGEELGLHGRYTNSPARQVSDISGWRGDEYHIEISGAVEESVIFGDKLRLTRTITSEIGGKSFIIHDVAENFGYAASPFTILYHINPGFPLLDASSELFLTAGKTVPYDEHSRAEIDSFRTFSAPIPGFQEQNFLHTMRSDGDGMAYAAMVNRKLRGGLGLYIRFDAKALPYLNEWKMLGQGDYVVGIEPCNSPCENRAAVRKKGLLPFIEPGETREMTVEIGVLDGPSEIDAFVKRVGEIAGGT